MNNLRQLLDLTPIGDLAEVFAEIERWQADMRQKYGDKMDADVLPAQ